MLVKCIQHFNNQKLCLIMLLHVKELPCPRNESLALYLSLKFLGLFEAAL